MTDDRLLQQILLEQDDTGWQMLCGCILLNLTSRRQVDRVWPRLFDKYPTPQVMESAGTLLNDMLRELGLVNRRTVALRRFSKEWLDSPDDITRAQGVRTMCYYGLGEYARDSWLIFMDGMLIDSDDKELKKYVQERSCVSYEDIVPA